MGDGMGVMTEEVEEGEESRRLEEGRGESRS